MNLDDAIRGAAEEICKDYVCANDVLPPGEGCQECGEAEKIAAILTRHLSPLLAAKNKRIAELEEEVARLRSEEHMQRVHEALEQGCRRTKGDIVLPE